MRPTELGAAIGQHALQRQIVFFEERDHSIIEQIGSSDGCLAVVELGKRHLAPPAHATTDEPVTAMRAAHEDPDELEYESHVIRLIQCG